MKRPVDARVHLRLYTTAEGGRQKAVDAPAYGYRPTARIDGKYFDFRVATAGRMELGDAYDVDIAFLDIENAKPRLGIGVGFCIWEGKDVGTGVILELVDRDDPSSSD
ncbi:hypothetical protein [Pinirhizobacter soli]|uniref:hypothetical protein n=1 Tax=Pinirhizobacter soli TaxID=2786953 RepID=UPI00202A1882|nr:hypothetical protein [Pinirhizobacter soli]